MSHKVYMYVDIEKPSMVYIGKTSLELHKRDSLHLKAKTNIPFDGFYRKHPENFYLMLISEHETDGGASRKEIELINEFNSLWPNGYNFMPGGSGGPSVWEKMSEDKKIKFANGKSEWAKEFMNRPEMKRRLSETSRRYSMLPEVRRARSERMRGDRNPNKNGIYGGGQYRKNKKLSDSAKKKLSESRRGENNPNYGNHRPWPAARWAAQERLREQKFQRLLDKRNDITKEER